MAYEPADARKSRPAKRPWKLPSQLIRVLRPPTFDRARLPSVAARSSGGRAAHGSASQPALEGPFSLDMAWALAAARQPALAREEAAESPGLAGSQPPQVALLSSAALRRPPAAPPRPEPHPSPEDRSTPPQAELRRVRCRAGASSIGPAPRASKGPSRRKKAIAETRDLLPAETTLPLPSWL